MPQLKIGQPAPRFSLKDKDGVPHSIGSSKTDFTVLYFYPKDDTPGCTLEAKEFSKFIAKFKTRNVRVVGISGGTQKTKASFCKKYSLKVPLVSDTDFAVAKSYGAYGTKKFMGRTYQGILRKTFLVDKTGKIAQIFGAVSPEGHAAEVLSVIDALKIGATQKVTPKRSVQRKVAKRIAVKKAVAKRTVKRVASKRASRSGARSAKKR